MGLQFITCLSPSHAGTAQACVCRGTGLRHHTKNSASNWAPQEQCCELGALPRLTAAPGPGHPQGPGQSFPSLRYKKPGAHTGSAALEAHIKDVPVGLCDHWPTEQPVKSISQNMDVLQSQAGTPLERKILTAADFTRVKGTNPALTDGLHRNTPIVKRQKIRGAFNHAKTLTDCSARCWYLACMSCNNS